MMKAKKFVVWLSLFVIGAPSMAQTGATASSIDAACETVIQTRARAASDARARRQELFDNSIGAKIERMKQDCLNRLLNMKVQTLNNFDITKMLEDFVTGEINKACQAAQSEANQVFSSNSIGTSLPYGLEGVMNTKNVPIGTMTSPQVSPQTTFPSTNSVSPSVGQKILNTLGF